MLRRTCYYTLRTLTAFLCLFLTASIAYSQPVANFTASPRAGCSPLVVNFQDQSTGNPTAWSWNFGNGATSTLQNPSTTYFTAGTYTITLTATNGAGSNTLTRTSYITVYENPTVDFSANITAGCFPLRVQFSDLSTPGSGNSNTTWFWDLGNGTQSNVQNPLITYTTAGNFTVTLKVTNDKGCSKVLPRPNFINVAPGVTAGFDNTNPTECRPPSNISFTNSSTGPGTLAYTWNFGDGNTSTATNPVHTYTSTGTFSPYLVATSSSGCTDTIFIDTALVIGGNTTTFSGPDSVCVASPANFANTSTPNAVSVFWDFGDGTTSTSFTPIKSYASPGNFNVKLRVIYSNCVDSVIKPIRVLARPISSFTAPVTTRCQPPLTVNFTNTSTNGVSWEWLFGDGGTSTQQNPTHTYNSYGAFNVTLITTNASGCKDTLVMPAFVKVERPVITIPNLPVRGCVAYTISPSANIITHDVVTSYFWDFGDGNTSTASGPTNVYPNQGTYTVKLRITTSTGCTDSLVMPAAVRVGTRPTINFSGTPRDVCAYQPVQFTNQSAPTDQWEWEFGDGGTSTAQNPIHAYTDTGYFSVTLTGYNNGCPDSLTIPNYVHIKPPIAKFDATVNCNNRLQFTFTDQSIGAQTWFWEFGDGNTSTAQSPVHTYAALGTYDVRLTVTNDTCSHSIVNRIKTVDEIPSFHAWYTEGCKRFVTRLSVDNINPANVVNYNWTLGDGQIVNVPDSAVSVRYDNAGVYTVTLVITDVNGCQETFVRNNYITVNGPDTDFDVNSPRGCSEATFTFNDLTTTDGRNPITSWYFDFGDSTSQTFTSPPLTHVYNKVDTFSVKMIVTDAAGCIDSAFKRDMIITSNPIPRFGTNDTLTCPAGTVTFYNHSDGVGLGYLFDFGDGNTSTAVYPVHTYADTGFYNVTLTITDFNGCVDSLVRPIYINVSLPVASFTVNDSISSCTPFEVNFTNTSTFYAASMWDFGGGTSTLTDPTYYFTIPGVYNVQLIAKSPGGCTDTAWKQITVYDTTGARIDYQPLNGCKPLQIDLSATATGVYTYLWDYGDGSIDSTIGPTMTHTYTTFGDFIPKVILRDPAGCLIPVTGADTIIIRGANAKFGIDRQLLCDSGRVNFIDSTTFNENVTSYTWNFGDGNSSNLQNPVHNYAGTGNYNVSLIVQTQSGCNDTARLPNPIKIVQSPMIGIGGDTIACVFEQMIHTGEFHRQDTSAVEWEWLFPNGNISLLQNPPTQVYLTPGDYFITTIATNSSGCKDSSQKPIHVKPLPTVDMPATMMVQAGYPVTIPATYSQPTIIWDWTPTTGLSCSTCPQPQTAPKFNTKYTVAFTDSFGCSNIGEIEIIVFCKNSNVFVPNTFSPNGDGSNDVFYMRGRGLDRVKSLRIFNRWGEVVFEQKDFPVNDPGVGWNGKVKGRPPHPDVYVYQIEVFCDNGDIIQFNGNIALIL